MPQKPVRGTRSAASTGSRYVGGDKRYTALTSHSTPSSEKSYGRSVYGGKTFEDRAAAPKKKKTSKYAPKKPSYGQNNHKPQSGSKGVKSLGKYEGGKRIYFFDIHETGQGDKAMSITQTRNDNGRQRRDTILVFEDHLEEFIKAFTAAAKKL